MNTRDMKTQHKMTSTLLFLSRYVILGVENMRQTQKEFGDGMERKWKWKEVDYIHAHPLCLHSRKWKNGDHLKKLNDHSIFKIFFLKCLKSRHFYYTWLYRFIKKNWHSIYCDFWSISGQKAISGISISGHFWTRRESNTQPSDLESDALPLRHGSQGTHHSLRICIQTFDVDDITFVRWFVRWVVTCSRDEDVGSLDGSL